MVEPAPAASQPLNQPRSSVYVHPSKQLDVLGESGVYYAAVTREMLAIPGLSKSHIRVWVELYLQTMNRPGWWRSYRSLAEDIGMTRGTVIRAVRWLEGRGLVSVHQRRDEAGDDAPNTFRVYFPLAGGGVGNGTTPSRLHDTTPHGTLYPLGSTRSGTYVHPSKQLDVLSESGIYYAAVT